MNVTIKVQGQDGREVTLVIEIKDQQNKGRDNPSQLQRFEPPPGVYC